MNTVSTLLENKSILVTGGTGSFGKKFVEIVLRRYNPKKLIVFSRDELKQFDMAQVFPESRFPCMRYFIGDVRDADRLRRAFEGVDVVIHAAAMKQVPAAEYNPFEAVKTNIGGGQNVIDAAIDTGVKRVIALSTDKAAAPINLYGATKLASDKLFVAANTHRGDRDLRFSVVRYGNVMGSRGSVIPFFLERTKTGVLPVTDARMTRFNILLHEGVDFVLASLVRMWGGEIFVPKIPSYKILDVAAAVAPECSIEYVGIRPGEKIHEEMITETDALNTIEFDSYFVILPSVRTWDVDEFRMRSGPCEGKFCPDGFRYCSGTNNAWLSVTQLRDLLQNHLS